MRHAVFISQPALISPHWQNAFSHCKVFDQAPNQITADALVWILAGTPDWRALTQKYTQQRLPVIIMATELNIAELCQGLQLGARGYVEAFASQTVLKHVADTVDSGGIWIPGQLLANLVGVLSSQPLSYSHSCDFNLLSKREQQVAEIVVTGATNKQVAKLLNITERTVKEHMSSIFNKLKVKDRIQLMLTVKGR